MHQQPQQQHSSIPSPPNSTSSKLIKDEMDVYNHHHHQQQQGGGEALTASPLSASSSRRSTRLNSNTCVSHPRVPTPTSMVDWCDYWRHLCSSYSRVQLFRLKGAQRKLKTDRNKIEKNPPDLRKRYQPSSKVTLLYNCPFDPLYSLLPFVRHDFNVLSGGAASANGNGVSAAAVNCMLTSAVSSDASGSLADHSDSFNGNVLVNGTSSSSGVYASQDGSVDCKAAASNGYSMTANSLIYSTNGGSNASLYNHENQSSSILAENMTSGSGVGEPGSSFHSAQYSMSGDNGQNQQRYPPTFYLDSSYPSSGVSTAMSQNGNSSPVYNGVPMSLINGQQKQMYAVASNEPSSYQAEINVNILSSSYRYLRFSLSIQLNFI
jgi:hypothetical protein